MFSCNIIISVLNTLKILENQAHKFPAETYKVVETFDFHRFLLPKVYKHSI